MNVYYTKSQKHNSKSKKVETTETKLNKMQLSHYMVLHTSTVLFCMLATTCSIAEALRTSILYNRV